MNRSCANRDTCPGSDYPVTNFSSEAPDLITFRSFRPPIFGPPGALGPGGNGDPPFYVAEGCDSLCVSTISQEDADLCAQRAAQTCYLGGGGNTLFYNSAQICVLPCGAGSNFFWTVAAGQFVAGTQAAADEQALAYACEQAALHAFCMNQVDGTAQVGVAYSATVFVTGAAHTPVTFAVVAGALPPGLILTPEQGLSTVINGKPTTAGTYTFTIQATDAFGIFVQQQYTITVTGQLCSDFWTAMAAQMTPSCFPAPLGVCGATYAPNTAHLSATSGGANTAALYPSSVQGQSVNPTTSDLHCSVTVNFDAITNGGQIFYVVQIQDAVTHVDYFNTGNVINPPLGSTTYNFTIPAGVNVIVTLVVEVQDTAAIASYDCFMTLG